MFLQFLTSKIKNRVSRWYLVQTKFETDYLDDTSYNKISKRRGIYDQGSINTTNTHENTYKSKIWTKEPVNSCKIQPRLI